MSDGPPALLDGLLVVDATTGMAGSLAAMFLADFGADVVRVVDDGDDPGALVWHRSKRRPRPEEAADLADLVAAADVCVVSETAGELVGGPFDPVVCDAHLRLVQVSTPPWLGTGTPWRGGESDPLLAAATGVALRQASVEGGPIDAIYRHLLTVQGVWAAASTVAALVERESSGLGQRVTVGGLHGAMIASAAAFNFDDQAAEPGGRRAGGSGGGVPFYRTYRCADGEWLFLAALTPRFTTIAFDVLDKSDLFDDLRLEGKGRAGMLSPDHAAWVIDELAAVFASRPREDWLVALTAAGCPAGPLLDRDEWLDHPQLDAIGMRLERDGVVMPGHPLNIEPHTPSAPRLPSRATGNGPLGGVRVLDLGAIIAGPFAASLLGELGADVIKVEPLTGDSFRGPGFAAYNKGQRGIALDLQHPDGRAALLDLARDADVVVDNYRPGVLGRLGLRHEDLVEVNPSIVTLTVTGFGQGGPLGLEPGFDPVLQAMSGMMTAQGGDGDPVFFTVPVNDVTAAASGALTVALALLHRARTGEGSRTWTSLAGMSALLQASELVRAEGRSAPPVGGTDHRGPSAHDRFHQAADGWVRVVGAPADPSWATMNRAEVVESVAARGVAAAPARRLPELLADEAVATADVFHRDPRPGRDTWWTPGRHARFSRTELSGTLVSPSLGQHTREVLAESGFDEDRIEALIAGGVAGAR